MKLHLPVQLLRALVLMCGQCSVHAAIMHSDVSYNTYVDFASNTGRYVVGTTNELLDYIRESEDGVRIEYTNGATAYTLPHGMLSFDSVADMGNATLVNYNYVVTVKHNTTLNPTFGANKSGIGVNNALIYKGIEEEGTSNKFVLDAPTADYKLVRLSRLVTDAVSTTLHNPEIIEGKTDMSGQLVYRVGGGEHWLKDYDGKNKLVISGGGFNLGGVGTIHSWEDKTSMASAEDYKYAVIKGKESWSQNGFSSQTPLPFGSVGGDSGSPYFVWNASESRFELLMAHTGSYNSGEMMVGQAAPRWSQSTMDEYNVHVDMAGTDGTVIIKGIEKPDDKEPSITDGIKGEGASVATQVSVAPSYGYLYQGNGWTITDDGGNALKYAGVESGTHTWKSLSDLKDKDTWYTYGNDRLNATASVVLKDKDHVPAEGLTYAKLYTTQNLVFGAEKDNETYTIKVDADTDLGVGYVRFAAEKCSGVVFNVESEKNNLLNSAGYVVDAGVQVNVKLRNVDSGYMREWRKVGEGTLNICGSGGNNEIFLNVGGKGKTLLNQEKGNYAAYNVLVNTGSTVVIADTGQIKRDLTFGNGGGTLDMNGNRMDWYLSEGQNRDGFTIHALTEEAVISNSSSECAVLSFMEGGNQSFVGSFCDSKDSALGITYAGGGTWELNSIRTCLENADSGLIVANGTVKLAGTLTVHGLGSLVHEDGTPVYDANSNALFSTRDKDWHYADATMNVTVQNGAAFELESHARLTGTVTVESGGKYIMHEGVQDDYEYIEGGEKLESTAAIKAYYGHKGDVKLAKDATLSWQRGSTELASLKGTAESGALEKVESTISSETRLRLEAAEGKSGRIASAVMSLQKNVSVELCELYLDSSSAITSADGATVSMQETTLALGSGNTTLTSTTLDSALTLSMSGNTDIQMQLAAGTAVLDVESTALRGFLTLTGTGMVLDFTELTEPVDGWVRVHFGENVKFDDAEKLTVTALTATGGAVGYFAPADVGFVYFNIPEPATATLSLLALAALAARRRRK